MWPSKIGTDEAKDIKSDDLDDLEELVNKDLEELKTMVY
jgi:hypothetical protein